MGPQKPAALAVPAVLSAGLLPTGMPREGEAATAAMSVCRLWLAGWCEFGDRETIGSRAAKAQSAPFWPETDSDSCNGSSTSSHGHSSSASKTRSWADQSQDTWPEESFRPPLPGVAPDGVRQGTFPYGLDLQRPSERQLPDFGDRLGFPEYFPSSSPLERGRGIGEGHAEQDGKAAQAAAARGPARRVPGPEHGARRRGGGRGPGHGARLGRPPLAAPVLPSVGVGVAPEAPGALPNSTPPGPAELQGLRRREESL
ncbi:unnamed protein product [Prorocentrum cordatum]|uniref:Uncharacterized protein n=1 Tax=Prorocentrum cordatum TaxID=2364126 RepID=A0ABN9WTW1_9DINO|nr:unnamed protein product [Polarella glacialis]